MPRDRGRSRPHRPRTPTRAGGPPLDLSWRDVIASYGLLLAVPVLLWVASEPLVGTLAVATAAVAVAVGRRVHRLVRCLRDCGGFVVDLGRTTRICVTSQRATELE